MPISVTCQCGARLEIDEKFLGKEIPCPDCQRPLPTKPPATPPPLELPLHQRKSGLAILSLTLALVGAFTLVLPIAAMAVGILALKQIAAKPGKLDGVNFAKAGIIVSGVGLFLTLALMIYPFGIDQFLRDLAFATKTDYATADGNLFTDTDGRVKFARPKVNPNYWSRWISPGLLPANVEPDILILVNTHDDAFISCFHAFEVNVDEAEEKQKKVLDRFYRSELVNLMGNLGNNPLNREGVVVKKGPIEGDKWEVELELRLNWVNRRFLIQYPAKEKGTIPVVVGAVRASRFEAVQKDFHEFLSAAVFNK